ncbi:prepilin-type N-terminal cleavage/methylation domain-containing protein [Desulfobaculum xiamenense]|uniref:Prepilin-type N-terminal cleavage/methylation domain-containing protein n=1 Tax=Desulfobaculum xiamenense TaxID=995050 RepID=A0A846QN24_9BACT|nr:prepilin-type N-terminal cleavage/methylation domain-containing protein [Desulfobaculum xiamenense]NJB67872.1 prepilin-type N-terminal cleavage/methylation domain-containing protein [Desulfobaculum xiamenense]
MQNIRNGNRPGGVTAPARTRGFTIIEMAIVVVIVGILISASSFAWVTVWEGRRLGKTNAVLIEVRNCLVKRMYYSNAYPSYSGDATAGRTDNTDCDPANVNATGKDVDACMCGFLDAWGNRLFLIEGVRDPSDTPLGESAPAYITDNPAKGHNATAPSSTRSIIVDKDGNTVRYIVFVLVSPGKDGQLDDDSYRKLFEEGAGTQHIAVLDPDDPPNFDFGALPDYAGADPDRGDDDLYLYVTAPELRSILSD